MRIAIVIPTRGDRDKFMARCVKRMMQQTLKPDIIEIVSDEPLTKEKDITWRYRIGVARAIKRGAELIFFIENDDYYAKDYIERMVKMWIENGRPKMLSLNRCIYYNLKSRAYFEMSHPGRGGMFMTMARAEVFKDFKWNADNDPWTDIHIWKQIPGAAVEKNKNDKWIAIGIKHGVGLCGGNGHNTAIVDRRTIQDGDWDWLRGQIGDEDVEFYKQILN